MALHLIAACLTAQLAFAAMQVVWKARIEHGAERVEQLRDGAQPLRRLHLV